MPTQAHAAVAARLRTEKNRVLRVWEQRVRECVPAARQTETLALIDSLPELIDRLATAIATPAQESVLKAHGHKPAAEHGKQRADLNQYSLDQVIAEYEVLRVVLVELLKEQQPWDPEAMQTLSDFVLSALRDAALEFSRRRTDERDKALTTLEDAYRDLDKRVNDRVAELRISEERFRHFVESVKDYAIFTLDPSGTITTWNVGCVRMKQYAVEEAIGQNFAMLYPEEGIRRDEPGAHLRAAAIEGRFRGEGVRVRKSGDQFLADVCITPIYEGETLAGYTKVVQDLTERNLLMQERDLSRSNAERMRIETEYRDRFVTAVTHDIRTPLSAAKSAAELILRAPENKRKCGRGRCVCRTRSTASTA